MKLSNPETPLVLASLSEWTQLYENGWSCPAIARKYGVHTSTVHRRLKSIVTIRTKSETKIGKLNPMWTDDSVSIGAVHAWVRSRLPRPDRCEECENEPPRDLANIMPSPNPETYTRELKNWRWLCRRCHMKSDGRIDRLYHGGMKPIHTSCTVCPNKHEAKGYCAKHYTQYRKYGRLVK